jgi:hypothetical protein
MTLKETGTSCCSAKCRSREQQEKIHGLRALPIKRDVFRPRDTPRFAYTYVVPGLFAQDDINVTSWLSVSASARLDFHNR